MNLKSILSGIAGLSLACSLAVATGAGSAEAASGYPLKKPREVDWSFAGPFGTWDKAQLQRGFKVYREICAACHSMDLVAFRTLDDLGYSDEQVQAIASEYDVTDGPNEEGEMFTRPGRPTDYFPSPYENDKAAAYANNGAVPPDFSLIAKARAPERGFPTFIFDVLTLYAENGPDYIYSLLTGYGEEPPESIEISDGTYYNPYFIAGPALAMAQPLYEGMVTYDDGSPETVDQYSKDVSAFLMWAAEPMLVERKQMGFNVMLFLLIFASLLYFTKKKVWSGLKD